MWIFIFLHRDDPKIPVEEIMPVLNDFYESGKIHFIGVSNWTTQRIEEANKFAEKKRYGAYQDQSDKLQPCSFER